LTWASTRHRHHQPWVYWQLVNRDRRPRKPIMWHAPSNNLPGIITNGRKDRQAIILDAASIFCRNSGTRKILSVLTRLMSCAVMSMTFRCWC
jgi:hypothetical protein